MNAATYSLRDAFAPPGLVSLTRLPLAFVFPWAADRPAWAITVLALAGASDVLDGWLARRFHCVTPTGAVLDAVMDKLFFLVVAITLVVAHMLTVTEIALLVVRDLGELPLVVRAAARGGPSLFAPHTANLPGKLVTALQFATLVVVLLRVPHHGVWVAATAVCGSIAAAGYWHRELHADREAAQR